MNKRQVTGIILMGVALLFAEVEAAHFGYKWPPQTIQQVICECIVIALLAYGLYRYLTA